VFTQSKVIVLTNTDTSKQTHKPTHAQTNRSQRKHPTFFATLRWWLITWQLAAFCALLDYKFGSDQHTVAAGKVANQRWWFGGEIGHLACTFCLFHNCSRHRLPPWRYSGRYACPTNSFLDTYQQTWLSTFGTSLLADAVIHKQSLWDRTSVGRDPALLLLAFVINLWDLYYW